MYINVRVYCKHFWPIAPHKFLIKWADVVAAIVNKYFN